MKTVLTTADIAERKRFKFWQDAGIAQIALACGFADFGHFSRRYKDAFGASPREDRVTLRNGPTGGAGRS